MFLFIPIWFDFAFPKWWNYCRKFQCTKMECRWLNIGKNIISNSSKQKIYVSVSKIISTPCLIQENVGKCSVAFSVTKTQEFWWLTISLSRKSDKKRRYLLGTSFNFVFEFECIVSKAGVCCCCCLYDRVHCYFLSVLQAIVATKIILSEAAYPIQKNK